MPTRTILLFGAIFGLVAGALAWWLHHASPASRLALDTERPTDQRPDSDRAPISPTPVAAHETDADPIMARIIHSGPMARPRDFFRVIVRPSFLSVADAARSMSDDEVVLGLEVAGELRAYPINYLNEHELVREEIGGVPLLVSW